MTGKVTILKAGELSLTNQGYKVLGCSSGEGSANKAANNVWDMMGQGTFVNSDGNTIFNSENRDIDNNGVIDIKDFEALQKNLDLNENGKIDLDEAGRIGNFYNYDGDDRIGKADQKADELLAGLTRQRNKDGKLEWILGEPTEQGKKNVEAYHAAEFGGSQHYNPVTPAPNLQDPEYGPWTEKMVNRFGLLNKAAG